MPHTFTLRFKLPPAQPDPRHWLDALFEAGCDDATIGVGRAGVISLEFERDAPTREDALSTAIADVKRTIPGIVSNDARIRRVLGEIENSPGADILTPAFAARLAALTEGIEVDLDEAIEGDISLRSEVQ